MSTLNTGGWGSDIPLIGCHGTSHKRCQFIEGDPSAIPFDGDLDSLYCGKPAMSGRSYCAEHTARCYAPTTKARKADPHEAERRRASMRRRAMLEAAERVGAEP